MGIVIFGMTCRGSYSFRDGISLVLCICIILYDYKGFYWIFTVFCTIFIDVSVFIDVNCFEVSVEEKRHKNEINIK